MDRKKVCKKSSAKKKMMSIELKREIIEKHEQGVRVVDLSRQYGRSTSMICSVLKRKESIKKKQLQGDTLMQTIICEKARAIYGDLLKQTPQTSIDEASEESFKASWGWFENFKKRSGIHSVVRHDVTTVILRSLVQIRLEGAGEHVTSLCARIRDRGGRQMRNEERRSGPPLTLTSSCVERMKQVVPKENYLRLAVEGGGCSGFQYKFAIESQLNDDDYVLHANGHKLVIDPTSLEILRGSTVDYHIELIRSSFRVINIPAAEHGCSCGVSFALRSKKTTDSMPE
ncbi:ISCA2 [Cordylochernes scorpioides]|uniref:ISCA2 n=1 Tax=Cordylochernes scorpioides TaxID=51811 RepID=A0ABY6KUL7_9ARAC|nr:ISCA2 [Cordylochernes scorpioides]